MMVCPLFRLTICPNLALQPPSQRLFTIFGNIGAFRGFPEIMFAGCESMMGFPNSLSRIEQPSGLDSHGWPHPSSYCFYSVSHPSAGFTTQARAILLPRIRLCLAYCWWKRLPSKTDRGNKPNIMVLQQAVRTVQLLLQLPLSIPGAS